MPISKGVGASLKLAKSFDVMDIVSITAWQRRSLDSFTDNDYAGIYSNNAEVDFFDETYTQEIQFISNDKQRRSPGSVRPVLPRPGGMGQIHDHRPAFQFVPPAAGGP